VFTRDIISEASEVTGLALGPVLYNRITRAIQVLANKGNFDALLVYVVMNVQEGNILYCPREIDIPLKININSKPAFSRTRLYQFTLNGPGDDDTQLSGWQWIEELTSPIMVDLSEVGTTIKVIPASPTYAGDDGKLVRIWGFDVNGVEISDILTINHTTPPTTTNIYGTVDRVSKDLTIQNVILQTPSGNQLANYYPDEIFPQYRKIKLSKNAASVRMLCRRKTYVVATDDDFIPLDSSNAIIMMLRAREKFLRAEPNGTAFADAEALEKKAVQYLQEEQAVIDSVAAMAQSTEKATSLNLNINNRDSVIVADIYDFASDLLGPIGQNKIFDSITDAREILMRKYPAWAGTEGYVDLKTNRNRTVTLPRYIEVPLKIKMGRTPLTYKHRWAEFHRNVCGSNWGDECSSSYEHWIPVGEVVTICDPSSAQQLVGINDLQEDDGATIRVFGYDENGKYIRTPNDDLEDEDHPWLDGFELTAYQANVFPDSECPRVKRITRITRTATQGYTKLLAYSDDHNTQTMIGYYMPDETEPRYQRIKLPRHCPWIRMRYRMRTLKITSLTDQLNLKSKVSMEMMLRAIKAMRADPADIPGAEAFEAKAVKYLREEEVTQYPEGAVIFENDGDSDMADPEQNFVF
jgi:hypothetical protein